MSPSDRCRPSIGPVGVCPYACRLNDSLVDETNEKKHTLYRTLHVTRQEADTTCVESSRFVAVSLRNKPQSLKPFEDQVHHCVRGVVRGAMRFNMSKYCQEARLLRLSSRKRSSKSTSVCCLSNDMRRSSFTKCGTSWNFILGCNLIELTKCLVAAISTNI